MIVKNNPALVHAQFKNNPALGPIAGNGTCGTEAHLMNRSGSYQGTPDQFREGAGSVSWKIAMLKQLIPANFTKPYLHL